ncbi:MAG: hypothetical protein IJ757_03385 [Clostridiales bacterium]|nr:hypothetical protein [Clostridiales bacterium]
MKTAGLWLYRITVLLIIVLLPFFLLGGADFILGKNPDAVSGATVISEGDFESESGVVVLINRNVRKDPANTDLWLQFFQEGPAPDIFEDISVLIIEGDGITSEYCEFMMGRLPVNQMTVRSETSILVMSKAKYGKFDIIVMSEQLYENLGGSGIVEGNDDIAMCVVR